MYWNRHTDSTDSQTDIRLQNIKHWFQLFNKLSQNLWRIFYPNEMLLVFYLMSHAPPLGLSIHLGSKVRKLILALSSAFILFQLFVSATNKKTFHKKPTQSIVEHLIKNDLLNIKKSPMNMELWVRNDLNTCNVKCKLT